MLGRAAQAHNGQDTPSDDDRVREMHHEHWQLRLSMGLSCPAHHVLRWLPENLPMPIGMELDMQPLDDYCRLSTLQHNHSCQWRYDKSRKAWTDEQPQPAQPSLPQWLRDSATHRHRARDLFAAAAVPDVPNDARRRSEHDEKREDSQLGLASNILARSSAPSNASSNAAASSNRSGGDQRQSAARSSQQQRGQSQGGPPYQQPNQPPNPPPNQPPNLPPNQPLGFSPIPSYEMRKALLTVLWKNNTTKLQCQNGRPMHNRWECETCHELVIWGGDTRRPKPWYCPTTTHTLCWFRRQSGDPEPPAFVLEARAEYQRLADEAYGRLNAANIPYDDQIRVPPQSASSSAAMAATNQSARPSQSAPSASSNAQASANAASQGQANQAPPAQDQHVYGVPQQDVREMQQYQRSQALSQSMADPSSSQPAQSQAAEHKQPDHQQQQSQQAEHKQPDTHLAAHQQGRHRHYRASAIDDTFEAESNALRRVYGDATSVPGNMLNAGAPASTASLQLSNNNIYQSHLLRFPSQVQNHLLPWIVNSPSMSSGCAIASFAMVQTSHSQNNRRLQNLLNLNNTRAAMQLEGMYMHLHRLPLCLFLFLLLFRLSDTLPCAKDIDIHASRSSCVGTGIFPMCQYHELSRP